MTPMRKGALGVERLNQILQNHLNPPSPEKKEKEAGGIIYRTGDKVMQIRNNYQLEWEIRSRYVSLLTRAPAFSTAIWV